MISLAIFAIVLIYSDTINMKEFVLLLPFVVCSCTIGERDLKGNWIEVLPSDMSYVQGISLKDNGLAETVGMETLKYHEWKKQGNKLILNGESIGNGQTILFSDTFDIISLSNDTLVLQDRGRVATYTRINEGKMTFKPSKQPYEGFFDIYDNSPDKSVFMEIGQNAPFIDKNSIELCETEMDSTSMDQLYTIEGELRIGHEVRAFTPSGSDREFWIVDKTGLLLEMYDKITKGQKNGKPVKATLRLEYNGKWDDGFAAEYDGTYLVREVVELKAE